MAVSITVSGLTAQQKQDIADAFEATQGPRPPGMTKEVFVTSCTLRFWKAVVKGWRRGIHEATISTEQANVDTTFPTEVE